MIRIRRILSRSNLLIVLTISTLLVISMTSCDPSVRPGNSQQSSDQSSVDYSKATLTDILISQTIDETTKTAIDPQSTFSVSVNALWITAQIGGGLPAVDVKCNVYVLYEEGGQEFSVYASSELAGDGQRIAYPITLSSFESDKIGSYVAKFYAGPDDVYITSAYFNITG